MIRIEAVVCFLFPGWTKAGNIVFCFVFFEKPENLLLNPERDKLVICDLGSAKRVTDGTYNKAYICSRLYRAPELLCGCENYTPKLGNSFYFFCFTIPFFLSVRETHSNILRTMSSRSHFLDFQDICSNHGMDLKVFLEIQKV